MTDGGVRLFLLALHDHVHHSFRAARVVLKHAQLEALDVGMALQVRYPRYLCEARKRGKKNIYWQFVKPQSWVRTG